MLSIEDRTMWARAEERARKVRPHVRMIEFGKYEVASSQPDHPPYTVTFGKVEGRWATTCTCVAHTGPVTLTEEQRKTYQPKPCLHCIAAYAAHRIQVNIHKQLRAGDVSPATSPKCSVCGESANAWTGSEWLCWSHLLDRAAEEDQAEANAIETEAELDSVREMEYTDDMAAKDYQDIFG